MDDHHNRGRVVWLHGAAELKCDWSKEFEVGNGSLFDPCVKTIGCGYFDCHIWR